MRRSTRTGKHVAALAPVLAITLILNGSHWTLAQGTPATGAPATPASPADNTAPNLPAGPAPMPADTTPSSAATAATGTTPSTTPPLTLQQVVDIAINNNSSVILARQRLQKEQYQIDTVNAQARPQVTASIVDSYSSQKSYGAAGGASVTSPTLPGGGTIPTITDAGGGTTSTFVGGGGGGTAASSGTASTTTTGSITSPATTSGATITPSISGGGIVGAGGGTGTGTATTGTGTAGTGTTTGSTGTATGQAIVMHALPPIAQRYVTVMNAPATGTARAAAAGPRATTPTGGSNSPTSTTTGTNIGSSNSGYNNNYEGRATVTQYIDLFGFVPTTLEVEKITRDFYQIDLQRIQNETALAAKDDFFTVLRDQAQIGVDQDQVNAAAANLRITQVRQIAGTAAEADVLTAEVTLSNDQQTEVTDQNTLNLAAANLDNLLNLPPSNQIALATPPLPSFKAAVDLNKSTQIALKNRPELVQAQNNITIAQKLIRLAGASLYPTLGLSGEASYNGNDVPGSPHDDYTITAQLDIPLYDGGYAHAQVQSAKVDLATQQTTQSQLEQNVILEVRQAYLDIVNDQVRGASAQVSTANAVEAARIARLQYQYGTNTFLNVLNAEAQLATAETDELNAEFGYQTDLATLVRAIGGR